MKILLFFLIFSFLFNYNNTQYKDIIDKIILLQTESNNATNDINKKVKGLITNLENLMSYLVQLTMENMTVIKVEDQTEKDDIDICRNVFAMFYNSVNTSNISNLSRYFLRVLYTDSSKRKNDLSTYETCINSQTISKSSIEELGLQEMTKEIQENSTYMIVDVKEKKNKAEFAGINYQENEYLLGFCTKVGCPERAFKHFFLQLNSEMKFFDEIDEKEGGIKVYDIKNKEYGDTLYIWCLLPYLFILIFILFSCIKLLPSLVFSYYQKKNPVKYNELKECFNIKQNFLEIFGNPQENENIVTNDTGLSFIKGMRGINMIMILITTTFFYIFHLPTKIYNSNSFKDILTGYSIIAIYYGHKFGIKILYGISGFELIYKMINYLDQCIEAKERLDDKGEEKPKHIINMVELPEEEKLKNEEKKIENNEEKEEEEEEDEEEDQKKLQEIMAKNRFKNKNTNVKDSFANDDYEEDKNENEPKENYFRDFENIDLSNKEEVTKIEAINKVVYKRHRSRLQGKILLIFILKQWHKYFLFFLAIILYKFGVIKPFISFTNKNPMRILYLNLVADKFTALQIFGNLFLFSPFSYKTYNEMDPFCIIYNEIFFFLIGSSLIFLCYKYSKRLDVLLIVLAFFLIIIKLIVGASIISSNPDSNEIYKNDSNHDFDLGYYPLMFYQYNEQNLKIKSFLNSNQFFNMPVFLLGMFFGTINYCIQNFSKANDKNKKYLVWAKKILNCISKIRSFRSLYPLVSFGIFVFSIFIYKICLDSTIDESKLNATVINFFIDDTYNIITLIDADIGILFLFLSFMFLFMSGGSILLSFLSHKFWGILSRGYWLFFLLLHYCCCYTFYLYENRIKVCINNIIFFSCEILFLVVIFIIIFFVFIEIPLKKLNKIFIKSKENLRDSMKIN